MHFLALLVVKNYKFVESNLVEILCDSVIVLSILKTKITIFTSESLSDTDIKKIQSLFNEMPIKETLLALKFAKNRWLAKDAGTLKVGRKSIIQKETHSITTEQANWRLKNWKLMIANYRKRGYSYPTISRIKKLLFEISKKN